MSDQPLSISVALCTYNGAQFVRRQLDSIAAQSRPPLEVVVCDDISTDGTLAVVEEFARTAPFPVIAHRNDRNLGVAQNFGRAISLCRGDLIALSDQDDVWREDKLEISTRAFETDSQLALIFSDADLVDQNLEPLGKRLSDTGRIGVDERRAIDGPGAFPFLLRRNVATGATMVFRSTLRDLILPIPDKLLTYHDAWIVQLAAATSKITFLPEPLMMYRQHPGQHTWDFVYVHGARRVLDRAYYAAHYQQLVDLRNRIAGFSGTHAADPSVDIEPTLQLLDGYIEHLRRRSMLPASRAARLPSIVAELASGRYSRYSSGLRSAVRDLLSGL